MFERKTIRLRDERNVVWNDSTSTSERSAAGNAAEREFSIPTSLIAGASPGAANADLSSYLIEGASRTLQANEAVHRDRPLGYALKRGIDIAGSIACLVFFGPLMILAGLLVWAFSPGPIIFAQDRIGFGGQKFRILKFRTMHADADKALSSLLAADTLSSSEWLARQKLESDPRVTSFGRLLRLSSVDELPQLINVLKGDMSLIGPRPIVDGERARYGRYFDQYCAVRPGMTGLWQVSGRNNTTYRRRVALDVTYARRISLQLDLKILLLTIPAILGSDGCY